MLIALTQDQVRAMKEHNITAVYAGKIDEQLESEICEGQYHFVFVSLEALLTDSRW